MLGAIYMTVAVAFTLTIGVLNFLNFTIPTLFMLTGMVAWALVSRGYLTFAGTWVLAGRHCSSASPSPWRHRSWSSVSPSAT